MGVEEQANDHGLAAWLLHTPKWEEGEGINYPLEHFIDALSLPSVDPQPFNH